MTPGWSVLCRDLPGPEPPGLREAWVAIPATSEGLRDHQRDHDDDQPRDEHERRQVKEQNGRSLIEVAGYTSTDRRDPVFTS